MKGGKWVMDEAEVDAFNIQQQEQGKLFHQKLSHHSIFKLNVHVIY